MTGIEKITNERQRNLAAGWTAKEDDEYTDGELAEAAEFYVQAAYSLVRGADRDELQRMFTPSADLAGASSIGFVWPLQGDIVIEDDPVRNLAKAGALIAAEIDRLSREGN